MDEEDDSADEKENDEEEEEVIYPEIDDFVNSSGLHVRYRVPYPGSSKSLTYDQTVKNSTAWLKANGAHTYNSTFFFSLFFFAKVTC